MVERRKAPATPYAKPALHRFGRIRQLTSGGTMNPAETVQMFMGNDIVKWTERA